MLILIIGELKLCLKILLKKFPLLYINLIYIMNYIHKFLYILRTLKFDFHSILQKEDEDPK